MRISGFRIIYVLVALSLGCAQGGAVSETLRPKRSFEFLYSAEVIGLPQEAQEASIWFPVPQSDTNQEISHLEIKTTAPYQVHTEPVYGNKIGYIHLKGIPFKQTAGIAIELRFLVTRYEDRGGDYPTSPSEKVIQFLQPSRRGAIIPEIKEIATGIEARQTEPLGRVKEAYQYVLDNMEYKPVVSKANLKEGTGWGQGDTSWACHAQYGNCTDYHALFIALVQAMGIPAHFDIGFPLPSDSSEGTVAGYHCWAHYYLPGQGWVPVDVSEADKRQELRDYFFGAHDPHRVKFTTGRDLWLIPRQKGEPLNYFIYPYVEVDGVPHEKMTLRFSFIDL